jgi:hypothetical protein
VHDNILTLQPEAVLSSDWNRHALRLGADATIGRYGDHDGENYEDWHVFADGRLDLPNGNVTGALNHSNLHELRTSPDDIGGLEPTTYTVTAADLTWQFRPGALLIRPDVRFSTFTFHPTAVTAPGDPAQCVPTSNPTVDICSNSDRDRNALDFGLRLGYEVKPEYSMFVEGRAARFDYDRKVDYHGFQRSSDGYELLVGTTLDLGGKAFGEVYAGFRHWSFDDPRFENIDGPAFGAHVSWNVTGLTTLTVSADRTIEPTTIVNAAGILRTAFGLSIDHELLRNLLLWAKASVATEHFEGIDRDDDLLFTGFGAKYFMNRHVYLLVGVERESRDTSPADSGGRAYDIHTFELRLQGNL